MQPIPNNILEQFDAVLAKGQAASFFCVMITGYGFANTSISACGMKGYIWGRP
jgi:hypothetical protein